MYVGNCKGKPKYFETLDICFSFTMNDVADVVELEDLSHNSGRAWVLATWQ